MAHNYALFSIPAYMVIAMVPHAYSVFLITSNNNRKWDLASPRSTRNRAQVEKSVPQDCYRKFERCRAAHDNMMENFAFVVGGVLSGVFTKLDAQWMNIMCGLHLLSRLLYTMSYISISAQRWSPLRTVFYMTDSIIIFMMYWRAALVMM